MPAPEPKPGASTSDGEVRVCCPPETDPFDDIQDNQSDWDRYASLLPLKWCCVINDAFKAADQQAIWFQQRHQILVYIAAVAAPLTVLLAIAGLAFPTEPVTKWTEKRGDSECGGDSGGRRVRP